MTPTTRRYGIRDEADQPRPHPQNCPDFGQPKPSTGFSPVFWLVLVISIVGAQALLVFGLIGAK